MTTQKTTSLKAKKSVVAHPTDSTQLYLHDIGISPLLSAEEEVHFARLARDGVASANLFHIIEYIMSVQLNFSGNNTIATIHCF